MSGVDASAPARLRRLHVLETEFVIRGDPALHHYCEAFAGAYDAQTDLRPPVGRVDVEVVRDPDVALDAGETVQVHRSGTYTSWHFTGLRREGADGTALFMPTRNARVTLASGDRRMRIALHPNVDALHAGELVFHFCRALALYLRDRGNGWLLHASAVAKAGCALLFVGDQGAGKSTIFLESVLSQGCSPLANDRVLLSPGPAPVAKSWPGYLSMCEGTILRDARLAEAAYAYDRGDYPFATLRWPGPLKPVFVKAPDTKRMYPMTWFTEASGRAYVEEAPLAAVVLVRLGPNLSTGVEQLGPHDLESVRSTFDDNHFDLIEPAFSPWHGLPLAGRPLGIDRLFDELRQAAVPLVRMRLAIADLPQLGGLLDEIGGLADVAPPAAPRTALPA